MADKTLSQEFIDWAKRLRVMEVKLEGLSPFTGTAIKLRKEFNNLQATIPERYELEPTQGA